MKRLWWIGCIGVFIGAMAVHGQIYSGCGNTLQGGVSCPPECKKAGGVNLFDVFTGNAHRAARDLEVWGGVGEHQLVWQRYANTRFTGGKQYLGSGGNWRHSYQWEMADTAANQVSIFYPDGTINTFERVSTNVTLWLSTPAVPERLFVNTNINLYVLQRQNGWRYTFEKLTNDVSNIRYQMQYFHDSQSNRYDFAYDAGGRVTRVTEPAGRYLDIAYTPVNVNTATMTTVYTFGALPDNVWTYYQYNQYTAPSATIGISAPTAPTATSGT